MSLPQFAPGIGTDVLPRLVPKSVTLNWSPELKPSRTISVPLLGSVNVQGGLGAPMLVGSVPCPMPGAKLEPTPPN